MNYTKDQYRYCKDCNRRVLRPVELCWAEHGICPKCLGLKTHDEIKYEDDSLMRKEMNPYDLYMHEQTMAYIARGFR